MSPKHGISLTELLNQKNSERPYLTIAEGSTWSYRETLAEVTARGEALNGWGIHAGQRV